MAGWQRVAQMMRHTYTTVRNVLACSVCPVMGEVRVLLCVCVFLCVFFCVCTCARAHLPQPLTLTRLPCPLSCLVSDDEVAVVELLPPSTSALPPAAQPPSDECPFWQDLALDMLGQIMGQADCGLFNEPVDLAELPDYGDVIRTPMDFGTIRSNLARRRVWLGASLKSLPPMRLCES